MSVRAYRVNHIETEGRSSFNLWQDGELLNFFEENDSITAYTEDGGGYIEVPVAKLKEAIKKARQLQLDQYTVQALREDIAWAKKKNDEYVMYSCW